MTNIATICARGGSEGVPNKNIRNLLDKPLIVHTIEQALATTNIDTVYVSTDSTAIAKIAKKAGAIVPFIRPAELATSSIAKVPVIQHLAQWVTNNIGPFDKVIDLDPTSPLRKIEDIEQCIQLLDVDTDLVITAYASEKNPYFNMIEYTENGRVALVKSLGKVASRQQAPPVFSMNASVYVWHANTLEKGLWDSNIKLHIMPRERSIDIDSELDFKMVEFLMKEAQV